MFTIKTVAEKTGLTPYTIRYYAREGLLPSIRRNAKVIRLFREEDLEAIYIIECLKICGMIIKEIKNFIDWTMAGDSTIYKAGTIDVYDKMKPEEIPPEMREIRSRMKHVERVARRNFYKDEVTI